MAAGAGQVATWSQIASWYDQLVRGGSGPHELALETTMRLVPDLRGARVLDVAGGQAGRCSVTGSPNASPMIASVADGMGTSTSTWRPSTATEAPQSATTATPTCAQA
jgi:hypothetical protein